MDPNEQAIVDWLNTFELSSKCSKFADLKNGIILAEVLNEISPDHFDPDALNHEVADNWALAAGNLKILLRMLDEYFVNVCHVKVDTNDINMKNIAKTAEAEDVLCLLELIVGAAFLCEDKIRFITDIMGLSAAAQEVLKGLFEHFQSRQEDLAEEVTGADDGEGFEEETFGTATEEQEEVDMRRGNLNALNTPQAEAAVRSSEMIAHLQAENARLLGEVQHLQSDNGSLKLQLSRSRDNASARSNENNDAVESGRSSAQILEGHNQKLSSELESFKLECDQKALENHTLSQELKQAAARLELSKELQAKLEMENHQLCDELDIARDKANKLAKAELQIEKYAKKLEELTVLKKQNKELNDKLDSYLDQIHDLESTNKGLQTANRMVETYKNKAVELEREKFEAQSSAQVKEHALVQLQAECDALASGKMMVEDELTSVKNNLETLLEEREIERGLASRKVRSGSASSAEEGEGLYETQTVPELKDKVRRLERELKAALGAAGGGSGGAEGGDVELLREELADAQRIRKEREEALFAAKKQVQELSAELTKASRVAVDHEKHSSAAVELKETKQKLGETSNTVRLLEERLKEKETVINRLEQEKNKLENYTKRSLATFKEKYMSVLAQMKEEKRDLDHKVRVCIEKAEANHTNWHREERLISSAMFEIGVRIMDRKIQANMNLHNSAAAGYGGGGNENAAGGGNTFLGHQREALRGSAGEPGYAAGGVERKLFQNGPGSPI